MTTPATSSLQRIIEDIQTLAAEPKVPAKAAAEPVPVGMNVNHTAEAGAAAAGGFDATTTIDYDATTIMQLFGPPGGRQVKRNTSHLLGSGGTTPRWLQDAMNKPGRQRIRLAANPKPKNPARQERRIPLATPRPEVPPQWTEHLMIMTPEQARELQMTSDEQVLIVNAGALGAMGLGGSNVMASMHQTSSGSSGSSSSSSSVPSLPIVELDEEPDWGDSDTGSSSSSSSPGSGGSSSSSSSGGSSSSSS